jgi:hypothetical protein
VRCPVRHYNSTLKPALSGFCVGKALPWASLAEGAPNSPVHTGQSGAPGPETLSLVFQLIFKSVFVLESAFIPFVSFGDLDNNIFKGLTSLLSVEQEIQYDEHT